MSLDESKIICDCFFEILEEMLVEKKDDIHIEIRNFGVFDVKIKEAR